ncbi:potassium channel family protein [Tunicatimonas pelagia]|uniref:potassium channel family protein n=1 Tax=Tunicatimonas pelagia TaxID=931531 RepID=UPI002664E731|nr:potassium channel family protein [Tunicatimonas pelagia]WKN40518.1 potassium channel family protein [Tunicatimonas pelagia]
MLHRPQVEQEAIERVKGRVIYVLLAMMLLQLTYPISLYSTTHNVVYFSLYCGLLASGVYLASVSRGRRIAAITLAVLTLVAGIPWQLTGGQVVWLTLLSYAMLFLFQGMIILVLIDFIFATDSMNRDVLYAACTIYIILGNLFTALYMIIHTLDPEAFFVSGPLESPLPWQRIVYFSYSTLTTLGYGDIAPVSPWAQSLAAIESMTGLLYIAIILGRLVSVYKSSSDK